ncbi:MAG: hypothetical protein J6W29_04875 [Neisseriaceae bacterium]|nr:hypothetical protein [Neisseriaceae bacterium]
MNTQKRKRVEIEPFKEIIIGESISKNGTGKIIKLYRKFCLLDDTIYLVHRVFLKQPNDEYRFVGDKIVQAIQPDDKKYAALFDELKQEELF